MAEVELTLFVSGASDLSSRAIEYARRVCDAGLGDRCLLSIVDVHEDPEAAVDSRVFATPTLVRTRPLPIRKLVGDLSNADKVIRALELHVDDSPIALG
jgi:circadian clock protein KaiB